MLSHGLSAHTVAFAVKQLRNERKEGKRWRRAFILELLQFDVFADTFRKHLKLTPHVFLNSTAHMQHVYWRNMQPELFKIKPTEKDQEQYSNAILEGYIHMDRILERLLKVVGDDATIVFCNSDQPATLSALRRLRWKADLSSQRLYRFWTLGWT